MLAPDDHSGEVGALVAALRMYEWDRISIIATETQYARDWVKEFRSIWEGEQDTFTGQVAYSTTVRLNSVTHNVDEYSVKQALNEVPIDNPQVNSRIILLAAHSQHAYPILKIASNIGFQPDTIWVGPSAWIGALEFSKDDTTSWMKHQYPGYFGVVPYQHVRGFRQQTFLAKLREDQQRNANRDVWTTLPVFGPQLVDSIITMVMSLVFVTRNSGDYRNGTIVSNVMKLIDYHGVSGHVQFTSKGDLKDPRYTIVQLREIVRGSDPVWDKVGETHTQIGSAQLFSNVCFPQLGCVDSRLAGDNVPKDSYPIPETVDRLPGGVVAVLVIVFLVLTLVLMKYWRSHKSKQSIKQELDTFRTSIVGMRTASTHYVPSRSVQNDLHSEDEVGDIEQARVSVPSNKWRRHNKGFLQTQDRLVDPPNSKGIWCWKETPGSMHLHDPQRIEGDPFDCWVRYDENSNAWLETSYKEQHGKGECSPLPGYSVNFQTMMQTKISTKFQRAVQRIEVQPPSTRSTSEGLRLIDIKSIQMGGKIPSDICNEPQMVLVKGDVLQISQQRSDGWAFGTKVRCLGWL